MKITKVKITGKFGATTGEKTYNVMADNDDTARSIVMRNCAIEGISLLSCDEFKTIEVDITEHIIVFFSVKDSWCLDKVTQTKAVFYNRDDSRFGFTTLGHNKEVALQNAINYFNTEHYGHNVLC